MKKILGALLLIAILITGAISLTACGDEGDIPEGMQLVAGGESLGYYFYAPEEWSISNVGEIKSAYVSRLDTTSVSFAEIKSESFPEGTEDADTYFFNQYFKDTLSEFPTEPSVADPDGENTLFGKKDAAADKAKKYTFTYEYYDYTAKKTFKFGFMQILLKKGSSYYIFSYSASLEKKSGDTTYYDYYLGSGDEDSKVTSIINNFKFVTKISAENGDDKPATDGYVLISDSDLAGFDLYVPVKFKPDHASGAVSATAPDGSNITMTKSSGTGENVNTYMLRMLGELESTVTDLTYDFMRDKDGNIEYDESNPDNKIVKYEAVKFGNSDMSYAYEYSFKYNGESYSVYQVIIVSRQGLSYNGYVFTYTAKTENYDAHLSDIEEIIKKVKF